MITGLLRGEKIMTWDGKERRGKKRYGIKNSTLRYRRGGLFSSLRPFSARFLLLNISETGCHFITKEERSVGAILSVMFEAPKLPGKIRGSGKVIWCRRSEELNAYRIGVKFSSVTGRSWTLLKTLLDGAILENVEISTKVYLKEIQKL